MVHPLEIGVPRIHIDVGGVVPEYAERGNNRRVSVIFPLRGTTNFVEDEDSEEARLLPPPAQIGENPKKERGMINQVPEGLEVHDCVDNSISQTLLLIVSE
jgi:hypothetical protein